MGFGVLKPRDSRILGGLEGELIWKSGVPIQKKKMLDFWHASKGRKHYS